MIEALEAGAGAAEMPWPSDGDQRTAILADVASGRCLTVLERGMQRRRFSREFKLESFRLIKEQGVAVAKATRDLNVHETVLRRWVRDLSTDP